MSKISYGATPEFQKDFKRLLGKFRSLEDDLALVKITAIEFYHIGILNSQDVLEKKDIRAIFPIPGFRTEKIQVCKIKKFACKALKGRGSQSGIRIIYAFHCNTLKIDFIEIYFKGEKENEDRDRIKDYLKNIE